MRPTDALAGGLIAALLAAAPLAGQAHDHASHASPYAGQETSEIPSLTAQELADLRAGAGMGLARPAELNHYPGPKHVLELATDLGLSDEQLERVRRIHAEMEAAAIEAGSEVIEAEGTLNMRFRHGHIDEAALELSVAHIADLQGRLRFIHLRAHLETTALLTAEQVDAYDRLRGYGGPDGG